MTKEQLIEEARKRGIVPGAVVKTRWHNDWTLGPTDTWVETGGEIYDASPRNGAWIFRKNTWAEVVTPAPSTAPSEGLVDGMACDPDEHMRAAIVAKAKHVGLTDGLGHDDANVFVIRMRHNRLHLLNNPAPPFTMISVGEFYDRLCRMVKPIKVGEHTVQFNPGSIKVGCTTIDNETVRAIAAKLRD